MSNDGGNTGKPSEFASSLQAIQYPDGVTDAETGEVMVRLAQIAEQRSRIMNRPETDPNRPLVGRYRELAHAVRTLIDHNGSPASDYQGQMVVIGALALDALLKCRAVSPPLDDSSSGV